MRRAITLLMALVLALTGMTFIVSENAQAADYGSGLDIVIVIDRSGTMLNTDPQRTVLSVAKTLADISSVDNQIGSSVGISIIPYGYSLTDYGYGDDGFRFYNVSNEQELTGLKEKVDKLFNLQDGNDDTNTGLALEKAYKIIEERKALFPNHKFAVLLLSDGEVDVGDSRGFGNKATRMQVYGKNKETLAANETEESIKRGKQASESMRDAGIKLHCVGVYNGSMDKLGNNMKKWAETTEGLYEEMKSTRDNEELRELVNRIYHEINPQANYSDTIVIGEEGGYFEIEEGILQANIQIIPSFGDVSMVELNYVDNRTEQPVILTQRNIRQSSSNNLQNSYTVISLPNPEPGIYKIMINDNRNHNFKLIVFSIRDLLMKIDPIDDVQNRDTVRIRLSVTKDDIPYENANETPKITIKNDDGMIAVNMRDMHKDQNASGWYYYDYPTTGQGVFTVQAQMRKDGFTNFSNSEKFTVTASPVRPNAGSLNIPDFDGHAIEAYIDDNGTKDRRYDDYVIDYDDLTRDNFTNPDNRPITGFSAREVGCNGHVSITNDTQNRKIIISPLHDTGTNPCKVEFVAEFDRTQSEPVTAEVKIKDLQADIELTRQFPDGMQLKEIKGLLPREEIPETIGTDEHAAVTFDDIETFFKEPNKDDGEKFTVTCEITDQNGDSTNGIEWRVDDQTKSLYLKGITDGTYTVKVIAKSYDGSTAHYTFGITVKDMMMTYLIIGGVALAVILLLILIIRASVVGSKPSFRRGMLNIMLEYDGETEEGSAMLQRYGKKKVKLSTICTNNSIRMGKLRKNLEQITVTPKKNGGIQIHSNIKGVQVKDVVLHSMDSRTIELDRNGDRIIELEYDESETDY